MAKQNHILAVDGGGTKTIVWLADMDGKVIGKGKSGPMSLAATTPDQAVSNLFEALEQATAELSSIDISQAVIGLAGVDTPYEVEKARNLFSTALNNKFEIQKLVLVNDTEIALASGTSAKNAVVLISGTGSNCFGQNSKGKKVKTGGMDFLLSDQGSGYDIGQKVLRAVIKAYDGRGNQTVMEKLVCEHFNISSLAELKDKVYHPILNKTQIGQLAKICFDALEQQDMVANEILNIALEELILMVATVLRKLEIENEATDLVLVGSIATDPYMRKQLDKRLTSRFFKLQIVVPKEPAVAGALKLALR